MSAKNKKAPAPAASKRSEDGPQSTLAPAPVGAEAGVATAEATVPFHQRHPKIANAIFAVLCVYVAMIWLLALDQTFHWGIFGPKVPLVP